MLFLWYQPVIVFPHQPRPLYAAPRIRPTPVRQDDDEALAIILALYALEMDDKWTLKT
jgi:hypothetical protein